MTLSLRFGRGSPTTKLSPRRTAEAVDGLVASFKGAKRVLLVPPDGSRADSGAGAITALFYERLCERAHVEVLPATGTHKRMRDVELARMFPGVPLSAYIDHDWQNDLVTLGEVPAEFVREASGGRVDFAIPCCVNRHVVEGEWDRIISIGQVVPHEVAGMSNHSKNIFVGCGGAATIHRTHYLSAVCGLEQIIGQAETPVRAVLRYMCEHFTAELPITYVLTVRATGESGRMVTRGLFAGDDEFCYFTCAALSRLVNVHVLGRRAAKVVAYLDPDKYRSTWLANKAIYRTRLALANGAELVVLAPGVEMFGEDAGIDAMIRQYGYRGTDAITRAVNEGGDLAGNLAAAAHLIHGSTEGRFRVTYCPGGLTREEVEGVGFGYSDLDEALKRYDPAKLQRGWNTLADGEEVFFVPDPGLGLWATRDTFELLPNEVVVHE